MSDVNPQTGEIWRADNGATRYVRDVDNDGYSVVYSRPADAHADWRTVLMPDWHRWVEGMNAKIMRGASTAKDWGYAANV